MPPVRRRHHVLAAVELVRDLGGLDAAATALAGTDHAEVVLDCLRTVVAQSDRIDPNDEVFWAVRRLLERLAERGRCVVAFEDLHWAEPTMLDLVEYIEAFATGPLVLLCIARPELLESRPSWLASRSSSWGTCRTPRRRARRGARRRGRGLRDRIASTSEGNPLFAEQLAVMMAESDVEPTDEIELPASIHALLAARLDGLEPAERRLLERASVVGKEFWRRAITDLSPDADRPP